MTTTPAIGDNLAPADADAITDRLAETHADLLKRAENLIAMSAGVPAIVTTDDVANNVADFIKELQGVAKDAGAKRVSEKEVYLEGGRRVDGFFKTRVLDKIASVKAAVERRLTTYQRLKANEERERRREEERVAREEAERLAAKAAEAEAALKKEDDLAGAVAAENKARDARADAERAKRLAEAPAADVSRIRSEQGSVASLRTFWTFADLDRATLDLEALRQHLPEKALEAAIRSFIDADGRKLEGVRIFEETKSVVR
jgi:hypothetical protein